MSTDKRLMSADERLVSVDSWSMQPDKLPLQTDGALQQVLFHQRVRWFAVGTSSSRQNPPDDRAGTHGTQEPDSRSQRDSSLLQLRQVALRVGADFDLALYGHDATPPAACLHKGRRRKRYRDSQGAVNCLLVKELEETAQCTYTIAGGSADQASRTETRPYENP
jgi:hypothetical protein